MVYVFLVVLVFSWQVIGLATISMIRPDLVEETKDAIINTWLWPAGLVATAVWKLVKRRDERQRQERISAKVASGEYAPDWARTYLKWNG